MSRPSLDPGNRARLILVRMRRTNMKRRPRGRDQGELFVSKCSPFGGSVHRGRRGAVRGGGLLAMTLAALLVTTACGGSSRTGTKIAWQAGTPGPDIAARGNVPVEDAQAPEPTVDRSQDPAGTIAVVERPT